MTDVYLRLSYREYKHLEEQLRDWETIETTHTSTDGFYHKALRLDIGDMTLEIQGPAVKEPIRELEDKSPFVCARCNKPSNGIIGNLCVYCYEEVGVT